MKIANSAVTMQSRHSSVVMDHRKETLRYWRGQRPSQEIQQEGRAVRFEEGAGAIGGEYSASGVQKGKECSPCEPDLGRAGPRDSVELLVLVALLERLTGRKIQLMDPSDLQPKGDGEVAVEGEGEGEGGGGGGGGESVGWGMAYRAEQTHYEAEKTSFSAQGVVTTADGREITFDVDLGMSRELIQHERVEILAGDALKDPLVINFDAPTAELTNAKFSFDLDADGLDDSISFVESGSGFLALDRNGDGMVNDGRELFGPSTGSGFGELAELDGDANGWIDEGDAVFDRLRVWSRDAEGNDRLLALAEVGVGAISLTHVTTPFSLTDDAGELQGQLAASSVYLEEDGGAGTVQEIDLVV
jgi:hypothetical protein